LDHGIELILPAEGVHARAHSAATIGVTRGREKNPP
jgi:hypothetical protein